MIQVELKHSDPDDVDERGIPQDSILGLLIFIFFNNKFPANSTEDDSVLYADDDTVNVCDGDPKELLNKIQREADLSTDWVSDNRMVCSGDKTKWLIIGTSQLRKSRLNEKVQIKVCSKPVEESKSETLLGLVVNNQLTWKDNLYVEQWREEGNAAGLTPQLSQRFGRLMPKKRLNIITQGLFYSKLIYCLQW